MSVSFSVLIAFTINLYLKSVVAAENKTMFNATTADKVDQSTELVTIKVLQVVAIVMAFIIAIAFVCYVSQNGFQYELEAIQRKLPMGPCCKGKGEQSTENIPLVETEYRDPDIM